MELSEAIRGRRSVRLYTGEPVADDTIRAMCEAAVLAPSSMNSQPWHFHVATEAVRDEVGQIMALTTRYLQEYIEVLGAEMVERAARFYEDLGGAPVVIAVSTPVVDDPLEQADGYMSVGAAVENLMLSALDAGLGSCNISAPKWVLDRLLEAFRVPEGRTIASLVLLGHPEEPDSPQERDFDVVTFVGR